RRHCVHMEFPLSEFGGQGMAEAATGLPINMRRVHCSHGAPSHSAAADLDWITAEFYKTNCLGCPHRSSSGEVPNLATLVAGREAATELEGKRQQERLNALRLEWSRRAEYRRLQRSQAAPPMKTALDDLDLVDCDPSSGPGDASAAISHLVV